MNEITVRTMAFDYSEARPDFIEGDPEESFFLLGVSLLLPYLEPYLIRTMRRARSELRDPALVDGLDRFCMQEGQHYRQHKRFNEAIGLCAVPGMAEIEAQMEADYLRFSESKSLRFNLAYAEGFEALTAALALNLLEDRGRRPIDPTVGDLMYWHLIEELEHRTVAFDVYEAVVGKYPYRLAVGLFAQQHLIRYAVRVAVTMVRSDPRWIEDSGGWAGFRARMWERVPRLVRTLVPKVLRTYMPWYSPRRIELQPWMLRLADEYSAAAKRTS